MKAIVNLLLFLASLSYPLYWLWGENAQILVLLPCLLGVLWGMKGCGEQGFMRYFAWVAAALLLVIGFTRRSDIMYGYPIMINSLMLVLFGASLWQRQTVIERFARMQTPDLSEQGVRYTRNVTKLWCGFFIFNIAVSILTLYFDLLNYWALYNGLVSYVLMGILMAGEWIVRRYVKKHDEK